MAKKKRDTIRDAVGAERLRIRYQSAKAGGAIITREIRPEELRGRYLFATDRQHGVNRIHSFRTDRIVSVKRTGKSFRSQ